MDNDDTNNNDVSRTIIVSKKIDQIKQGLFGLTEIISLWHAEP